VSSDDPQLLFLVILRNGILIFFLDLERTARPCSCTELGFFTVKLVPFVCLAMNDSATSG